MDFDITIRSHEELAGFVNAIRMMEQTRGKLTALGKDATQVTQQFEKATATLNQFAAKSEDNAKAVQQMMKGGGEGFEQLRHSLHLANVELAMMGVHIPGLHQLLRRAFSPEVLGISAAAIALREVVGLLKEAKQEWTDFNNAIRSATIRSGPGTLNGARETMAKIVESSRQLTEQIESTFRQQLSLSKLHEEDVRSMERQNEIRKSNLDLADKLVAAEIARRQAAGEITPSGAALETFQQGMREDERKRSEEIKNREGVLGKTQADAKEADTKQKQFEKEARDAEARKLEAEQQLHNHEEAAKIRREQLENKESPINKAIETAREKLKNVSGAYGQMSDQEIEEQIKAYQTNPSMMGGDAVASSMVIQLKLMQQARSQLKQAEGKRNALAGQVYATDPVDTMKYREASAEASIAAARTKQQMNDALTAFTTLTAKTKELAEELEKYKQESKNANQASAMSRLQTLAKEVPFVQELINAAHAEGLGRRGMSPAQLQERGKLAGIFKSLGLDANAVFGELKGEANDPGRLAGTISGIMGRAAVPQSVGEFQQNMQLAQHGVQLTDLQRQQNQAFAAFLQSIGLNVQSIIGALVNAANAQASQQQVIDMINRRLQGLGRTSRNPPN